MEVIRRFIDAKKIMSIIPLPETLRNRRLEVIVLPAEDNIEIIKRDDQIEGIVDLLSGSIPNNEMGLADYRAERLRKYEAVD